METVSVIIPALNEAANLPGLLEALKGQTRPPDEIILADAGSTDGTVELAQAAGALVVPGGMPAAGRNRGAAQASGSLLLFLDADVAFEPDFIERLVGGFVYHQLDAATCQIAPMSDRLADQFLCDATNVYIQVVQNISPHAPGFCILARRALHNQINGFDESAVMAEDHDYVQRAAALGTFGVLPLVSVRMSLRRLEKEGLVRLAVKYTYCELHALTGRPVRSMPFVYEFGSYDEPKARRLVDIAWLRSQLGRVENPLHRLSFPGVRTLRMLGRFQVQADLFEQRLRNLMPEELRSLNTYLNHRLALLRTMKVGRNLLPYLSSQASLDGENASPLDDPGIIRELPGDPPVFEGLGLLGSDMEAMQADEPGENQDELL